MRELLITATVLVACVPQRTDVAYPVQKVKGLDVEVTQAGNVGWMLDITNNTDETVRLVWDESSYTNSEGLSLGRLLRGNTKRINSDREQPDEPIPPGARMVEYCVPEAHAPAVGTMRTATAAGSAGELRLVFATDRAKATWISAIVFDGSGAPPRRRKQSLEPRKERRQMRAEAVAAAPRGYFCSGSASSPTAGLCTREKPDCVRARDVALGAVPDLTECALVETAWCYDDPGTGERCAPAREACDAMHARAFADIAPDMPSECEARE